MRTAQPTLQQSWLRSARATTEAARPPAPPPTHHQATCRLPPNTSQPPHHSHPHPPRHPETLRLNTEDPAVQHRIHHQNTNLTQPSRPHPTRLQRRDSSHKNKNSPPPRPQHHLQAPPGFPHPQPPPRPLLSHHLSPLSQRPHQQPAHHLVPVPLHLSNRHLLPP